MQDWFNIHKSINIAHHMDRMKDKTYDLHNRYRKRIQQMSTLFNEKKALNKLCIKVANLNLIKTIYN